MLMLATAAQAEVAGPPAPVIQKATPAQQAIALYHQEHDPPPSSKPCRRGTQEEITVCGQPNDRLPYPDQTGARAGARTATGEKPSTSGGVGASPMLQGKGAGLTVSIPFGPGATAAPVKVTGNED